jgi:DNA invertase Pin-like site-specific DNA recombinase
VSFRIERNCHHVAYYRVSTARQGRSGLGLEAQRAAVADYLAGAEPPLAEFVEVESGKRDDRPELAKALRHAAAVGATLLVAKLDRLSRDAHFLLGLQKAGVRFVCVDMPEANSLTVGLMAILAQHERELISRRTKEALAAAKARGKRLGSPRAAETLARVRNPGRAHAAVRANAQARADALRWALEEVISAGYTSHNAIARELNGRMILTPRSGLWTATSVRRLRERLGL